MRVGGRVRVVMDAAIADVERNDKSAIAQGFERVVNGCAGKGRNLRQEIVVDGVYGRMVLPFEQVVENVDALQRRANVSFLEKFGC